MALRTPPTDNRPLRPSLRLLSGQGMTSEAIEDERGIELAVVHDEALAHCRRMRFVIQRSLFDVEVFAAVRRPLLAELDRFERKFTDNEPERAA